MGNLTSAFLIVLMINLFLVMTQAAILDINPSGTQFLTASDTPLYTFAVNGSLNESNLKNQLPSSDSSVSPTTGNIFTDAWTAVSNWFLSSPIISFVLGMLSAPYNFLKALQVPNEFALMLGTLWYMMSLIIIVSYLRGVGD